MFRLQKKIDKAKAIAVPLNTHQIDVRAKNDSTLKHEWGGVYPSDLLAKQNVSRRPSGFVANTDSSNKNGSHWVSFYFPLEENVVEFYDSYGMAPSFYTPYFSQFINQNSKHLLRSDVDSQGLFSDVCGYYALGYLHMRSKGRSMNAIVKAFPVDRKNTNDKKIAEYVNHYIPMPRQKHLINKPVHNQTAQKKHENHARYNAVNND